MLLIYVIATRLTEREKKDREHKKQLLQIAKEHEKAREIERVQRYKMPQDMKKGEKGNQKKWLGCWKCESRHQI